MRAKKMSPHTANKKPVARKKRRSLLLFDEADALFSKHSEVKDAHDR